MSRPFAIAALLAASCIPDPGPMMMPGSNCMECHGGGGGGEEEDAVAWTVAGTWNGNGKDTFGGTSHHVYIQDSAGKSFTLRTNDAGNFYTREGLTFPITVAVDGRFMGGTNPTRVSDGSCNRCHGYAGGGGGGD